MPPPELLLELLPDDCGFCRLVLQPDSVKTSVKTSVKLIAIQRVLIIYPVLILIIPGKL